jgi:iron complex outermembrane receptor protein
MVSQKTISLLTALLLFVVCLDIFPQIADSSIFAIYSMDLEELMNTKVTIATKSVKPVSETPSVVSVITSGDIEKMGARQLEDILQTIPGFEMNMTFNSYYTVGIRGVKDSRTTSKLLVMIDGNAFNQLFHGGSIQFGYDINVDAIERIEIIRGPGSALYGRNAFSGVINIITKAVKPENNFIIKGTLGAYNTKMISGAFGYKTDKLNISVFARRLYTDYSNEMYNSKIYDITRNNFALNTTVSYKNLSFSGMFLNLKDGIFESNIYHKPFFYSFTYTKEINPKVSFDAKIYAHHASYNEDVELAPPDSVYFLKGYYVTPKTKEYLFGFETDWKFKLHRNNELLLGLQADMHGVYDVIITSNADSIANPLPIPIPNAGRENQVKYLPGWFDNEGHKYQNIAFLFQDMWNPFRTLSITVGARYDFDSQAGSQFNPRIGVVYQPYERVNIKFLYGRAYRTPSPAEQYTTLGFAFGNENLKPEVIKTYELAASYRFNTITNSISAYWNNLTDVIYSPSGTEINPDFRYHNIGKNTSTGIEYENKILMGRNIYTYLNFSYTFSQNTVMVEESDAFGNIFISDSVYNHPDIAPYKLNLGANYRFLKYFNCNLNMFYRSKMDKFRVYNRNTGIYEEVQDEIGNYAIFNFTFRIEDIVNRFDLSASVYNIFDTQYYSQDNQHLHQPSQPGRQMLISLSFAF